MPDISIAGIKIRRATLDDVPLMVDFNQQLFEFELPHNPTLNRDWPATHGHAFFTERIKSSRHVSLVAEHAGQPIGYLAGGLSDPAFYKLPVRPAELEDMFVVERFRCSGAGSCLVGTFFNWCRERSVERVTVVASANNYAALRFYRHHGFSDSTVSLEIPLHNGRI